MAKDSGKPLTVKEFVLGGNGEWRDMKDLSPEERRDFDKKISRTIAHSLSAALAKSPEYFNVCRNEGLVTNIIRR